MGWWGEEDSDDDAEAEAFLAAFRARRECVRSGTDARGQVLENADLLWLLMRWHALTLDTGGDKSVSTPGLRAFTAAARVCRAWAHAVHEALARDEDGPRVLLRRASASGAPQQSAKVFAKLRSRAQGPP